MPKYEAHKCDKPNEGNWCIHVDGVCDSSLGVFGSPEEAETEIRMLILRAKVKAIDPHAQFKAPVLAQNSEYFGSIVAVIEQAEGFDHGVAQALGRGDYALHTEKAFVGATLRNATVKIRYRDGAIQIESKEREGNER